ncbi:MAG: hypothetical protein AB8B67_00750 [Rickettsiaceae bacterium]
MLSPFRKIFDWIFSLFINPWNDQEVLSSEQDQAIAQTEDRCEIRKLDRDKENQVKKEAYLSKSTGDFGIAKSNVDEVFSKITSNFGSKSQKEKLLDAYKSVKAQQQISEIRDWKKLLSKIDAFIANKLEEHDDMKCSHNLLESEFELNIYQLEQITKDINCCAICNNIE